MNKKHISGISLIVGLIISLTPAFTYASCAVPTTPTWEKKTATAGIPYATLAIGTNLYTGGTSGGTPRIEKRNLSDGSFVWGVSSGSGASTVSSLATDGTALYVGLSTSASDVKNYIEKRSLVDGTLIWGPIAVGGWNTKIAVNGSFLYVAVTKGYSPSSQWRTEKHSLADGSLSVGITEAFQTFSNRTDAVAIDSSGLYVTGTNSSTWKTQKYDLGTLALIWSKVGDNYPSGEGSDLAIDSGGLYVTGSTGSGFGTEKRNLATGAVIWSRASIPGANNSPDGITVDSTGVYTAGFDNANQIATDWEWRVEKLDPSTGAPLWAWSYNPTTNYATGNYDFAERVVAASNSIYVVGQYGMNSSQANAKWDMMSLPQCGTSGGSYVDIGLKVKEATGITSIAAEAPGSITSLLRVALNSLVYGVAVVPISDVTNGTTVQVQTPSGPMRFRKYGTGGGGSSGPQLFYMSATPASINTNQSTSINWQAIDATSCTTNGGPWGTGTSIGTSGTRSTGALSSNGTFNFSMMCTGPSGSFTASVPVMVSAAPPPPPTDPCGNGTQCN